MHRHGYQGTKFHRERDQRQALIRSLAESLILHESIETTLPKAKVVARYTEKLVTKAKKAKDNLHNRRQVISSLDTLEAAHKLVDEIAPKLSSRNSGYFKVERSHLRRGDNAQMARVSFADELKSAKKSQKTSAVKEDESTPEQEQDKAKTTSQPVTDKSSGKLRSSAPTQAPKRSGVRGNR